MFYYVLKKKAAVNFEPNLDRACFLCLQIFKQKYQGWILAQNARKYPYSYDFRNFLHVKYRQVKISGLNDHLKFSDFRPWLLPYVLEIMKNRSRAVIFKLLF